MSLTKEEIAEIVREEIEKNIPLVLDKYFTDTHHPFTTRMNSILDKNKAPSARELAGF